VSTWVTLEPLSVTAEAGGEADVTLRVRNTSDIVEEYHVDVVGDPAHWCTVEPSSLRLYPGTTGSVRLTFRPPRGPDPAAGPHPYGVRVQPAEAPDAVTVPEGNVSVAPFTDVRAELLPVAVRGWSRARPRLVVDNFGNTSLTAAVMAGTRDNRVDFDIRTPSFQVPPGRAHFSVLKLRPAGLLWLGRKVTHPFTTTVRPSGSQAVSIDGTYVQTALLPSWLARLVTLLLGLAAAFLAVWFLVKPSVSSHATAQAAPTLAPIAQTQAPTKPTQAPTPTPTPTPSQAAAGAPPAAPKRPAVTLPAAVGWWKMDEGAGTIAQDSVGNHPATGANTGWCATKNCATFNGTSSAFTTSEPVLHTGPGKSFTVAAWVWLQSVPANNLFATAVSQDSGSNGDSGFYLQYSGTDKSWAFAMPGANGRALARGVPVTGSWEFLTGVFDASDDQMRLYVGGAEKATATDTQQAASTGPLVIGRAQFNGQPSDWFDGAIDNVEVFQKALTSAQVHLLYTKRKL
jgi:hypothetical protein